MAEVNTENFDDIKGRLQQIKQEVAAEDISLDDSLKLYEEAVNLGMKATEVVDSNVNEFVAKDAEEEATEPQKPVSEN